MKTIENLTFEDVINYGFTIEQIKQAKQFYTYVGELPQQMVKDFDIKQLYSIVTVTNKFGIESKMLYKTHSIVTIDNIQLNVVSDIARNVGKHKHFTKIKFLPFFAGMLDTGERYLDLVSLNQIDNAPSSTYVLYSQYNNTDKVGMFQTLKPIIEYYNMYIQLLRILNKKYDSNKQVLLESSFAPVPNNNNLWSKQIASINCIIILHDCGALRWYNNNDNNNIIHAEQIKNLKQ